MPKQTLVWCIGLAVTITTVLAGCSRTVTSLPDCPVRPQPIGARIPDEVPGRETCQSVPLLPGSRADFAAAVVPPEYHRPRGCGPRFAPCSVPGWPRPIGEFPTLMPDLDEFGLKPSFIQGGLVEAAHVLRTAPTTSAEKDAAVVQLARNWGLSLQCSGSIRGAGVPYFLVVAKTGDVLAWGPSELVTRIHALLGAEQPSPASRRVNITAVLRHFGEHALPHVVTHVTVFVHDDVLMEDVWHLAWAINHLMVDPHTGLPLHLDPNVVLRQQEEPPPLCSEEAEPFGERVAYNPVELRLIDITRAAPSAVVTQIERLGMPWPLVGD